MIAFPAHRLAIVTPPRNASSAWSAWAAQHGGEIWYGPTIDDRPPWPSGYDKHTAQIPHEARAWTVALLIRHPLERLISLYHHHHTAEALEGRPGLALWCFAGAVAKREDWLPPIYTRTQADYARELHAQNVDYQAWQLEDAPAQLATSLGQPVTIEPANQSFRRPTWQDYAQAPGGGAEFLALAKLYAQPDAQRWPEAWPDLAP